MFSRLGAEIVDTDLLAREVVAPGTEGLQCLVDCFGEKILNQNLTLNRPLLRRLIFADDVFREKLNQILHPLIYQAVIERLQAVKASVAMVVIPLYAGQKQYDWFDRICVVDVVEAVQLNRLLQRDSIDEQLANQMIHSQISRKQRLALANDVINNSGDPSALQNHVNLLMGFYQQCLSSLEGFAKLPARACPKSTE